MTDANFLQHEFTPTFSENDLVNVDIFNSYVKTIVNGEPMVPFSMDTKPDFEKWKAISNPQVGAAIRELSRLKYGRDMNQVEAEIGVRSHL